MNASTIDLVVNQGSVNYFLQFLQYQEFSTSLSICSQVSWYHCLPPIAPYHNNTQEYTNVKLNVRLNGQVVIDPRFRTANDQHRKYIRTLPSCQRQLLKLSNDSDNTHASNHSVLLGRLIGLLER